jgi:hypothetical protein
MKKPQAKKPPKPSAPASTKGRVFKTAWFAKEAKKAGITNTELCKALEEVAKGQCDDLGGSVYKKRLNKNMHRSIILAKGAKTWVYAFLFAKKDRENIEDDELAAFKKLAKEYAKLTDDQLDKAVKDGELLEIYNG